jgi:hypothetical protein
VEGGGKERGGKGERNERMLSCSQRRVAVTRTAGRRRTLTLLAVVAVKTLTRGREVFHREALGVDGPATKNCGRERLAVRLEVSERQQDIRSLGR